jgi:hypothetical protein
MDMSHEQAIAELRGLVEHRERVEASLERRFVDVLAHHRDQGVPWTVLADGLGVRKQTAHKVWSPRVARRRLEAGAPNPRTRRPVRDPHREASPS